MGALALAMLPASSAFADTFDFNFNGPKFSGSGTFTATFDSGDQWTITGVTGSVTSTLDGTSNINALLPVNSYPTGFGQTPNDNILIFPGTPGFRNPVYFDNAGVSFSLVNNDDVNLNDTFGFEATVDGKHNVTDLDYSISITDVGASPAPEPSSLLLLGTGVLGAAGVLRRKIAAGKATIA